jgi:hypothetical protein
MARMKPNMSDPVRLPSLPNILFTDGGAAIRIEDVTDSGLRELGRLWTQALVRKARNRRKIAKAIANKKAERSRQ